jgi:hypothetical protein
MAAFSQDPGNKLMHGIVQEPATLATAPCPVGGTGSSYLAGDGNALVAKYRTQAAGALDIWLPARESGALPKTTSAVDRGESFSRALCAELGVSPWTWRRLRTLTPGLIAGNGEDPPCIRLIARAIDAMGPDAPQCPERLLPTVCGYLCGLEHDPPARMTLALANCMGLEARRKGWDAVLGEPETDAPRGRGPIPIHAAHFFALPMVSLALRDLLLSANADKSHQLTELQISHAIPIAIRNLYTETSFSRLRKLLSEWINDMRRGGVAREALDVSASPLLIPDYSDRVRHVTVRQLIARDELEAEAREMDNCMATLWPQVAACMGVTFSLRTSDAFDRASVFLGVNREGTWTSECGGPGNAPMSDRLRVVAQDLAGQLTQALNDQPQDVQRRFQDAAAGKARYWPGSLLYTRVSTAMPAELERMRSWFPCGNLDPIARLRSAWP